MFHIILLIVFLDLLSLVVIVTLHNATYFIFLIILCDYNTLSLFGDPYNLTYTNIEIIVYTNIHWQEFFFNQSYVFHQKTEIQQCFVCLQNYPSLLTMKWDTINGERQFIFLQVQFFFKYSLNFKFKFSLYLLKYMFYYTCNAIV